MLPETELDRLIPAVPSDPTALETIYCAARKELFVFAYSILRQKEAAEDAVSETMLRLYRAAPKYRSCGNGRAYLYRICRNASMELLRKKHRQVPEETVEVETASSAFETKLYAEHLLQVLSVPQRQVMVLHYFSDLTFREIASVLSVPESTVKWRHNQALKQCRAAATQEDAYV